MFTSENLTDILEAVERQLQEVIKTGQEGKIKSLKESIDRIEELICDLKFEAEQLPF